MLIMAWPTYECEKDSENDHWWANREWEDEIEYRLKLM